jgi:hypothetical protein
MGDDELLGMASQWGTLTEAAQAAITAELETRKLKNDFRAEVQAAVDKPPGEPHSQIERLVFWLFIVSLPSMILLPRVWPENLRSGLYEMFAGVSYCWVVWLIVWLVLRARRIQRAK